MPNGFSNAGKLITGTVIAVVRYAIASCSINAFSSGSGSGSPDSQSNARMLLNIGKGLLKKFSPFSAVPGDFKTVQVRGAGNENVTIRQQGDLINIGDVQARLPELSRETPGKNLRGSRTMAGNALSVG